MQYIDDPYVDKNAPKSMLTALILAFFLGPLGLLYVSWRISLAFTLAALLMILAGGYIMVLAIWIGGLVMAYRLAGGRI